VTQVRSSRSEAGFGQKSSNARAGLVDYIPFRFNPAVMGPGTASPVSGLFLSCCGLPEAGCGTAPRWPTSVGRLLLGSGGSAQVGAHLMSALRIRADCVRP
jgi:hypothetical protein